MRGPENKAAEQSELRAGGPSDPPQGQLQEAPRQP